MKILASACLVVAGLAVGAVPAVAQTTVVRKEGMMGSKTVIKKRGMMGSKKVVIRRGPMGASKTVIHRREM